MVDTSEEIYYDEEEILQAANAIENILQHCNLSNEIIIAHPPSNSSKATSPASAISEIVAPIETPLEVAEERGSPLSLHLFYKQVKDFDKLQKQKLFQILETNVKLLFERSSWGWNPLERQKELFHPLSRFLIVSKSANFSDLVDNIVGFATFRFDWDDEDEPEHPVVYLYELQVVERFRSLGIGEKVMNYIKVISNKTNMWKILLTCFKYNIKALTFYKRIGFGIDHNSPSQSGFHGECYDILSDKPNLK
jgi:ribosomal protein S18 acetylase RimI-like enzyme